MRYRTGSRRNGFLLLGNGSEHVAGPGDVGKINLGLDFFFAASRTAGLRGRRLGFSG
jgi:hypothetical protein